jgi:serine/threonine-protein kinase
LSSPVDVDVLENGRLLGSSGAPIVMTSGSHQLELVNTTLGYRTHESVVVKAGQTTSLALSLPNGRLSINALPWAEVWVDDKLVGETPLGNLSLPIGAHQVVFRHPQLGERRQSAVVRADVVSRLSVNLQQ